MADVIVSGTPVEEEGKAEKTKNYVLRKGKPFSQGGKIYKPGESVPLTDSQAAAFADKFDSQESADVKARKELADKAAKDAVNIGVDTSQPGEKNKPQDEGARAVNPNAPVVNPGNRV